MDLELHYVDPRLVALYDAANPRGADTEFYLRLADRLAAQVIVDPAEAALDTIGLPADLVAASERWGLHKPSLDYFARLVAETGAAPEEIAYVGDRLDNDVLPARAAGLWAIFLRRGPWGHIHATWPEREQAHAQIDSLSELAGLLGLDPASPADVTRGRGGSA